MNYTEMLGRRSEILQRHIGNLINKENQFGLTKQENNFFQAMVKEYHRNKYELQASRKQS
ncbi:hypothetical protein [Paenibacillus xerothermodurans]|uniref:Uncharacterized protein n=1 Tax=Paenibacillus xerothermodurans TaxID=1977292 RepID=A0A2W1N4Q2_PAEXE|nr:hypothetical protein [Paenibacillus xerothermodurans]PZE19327.1 hypothetical protein CBW46_019150 [Paenibacillus xerothermodurans]